MTLLPIIYTSVLLFAALMLIIIFFSYIAFKLRGEKLNPAAKYKNEIANYKPAESIKNLASNYNPAPSKKAYYPEQQYYYNDRNSQRNNELKYSERKRLTTDNNAFDNSYNVIRTKSTYNKDRIKILNEIDNNTPTIKRSIPTTNSNNFYNVNMFNFYDNN